MMWMSRDSHTGGTSKRLTRDLRPRRARPARLEAPAGYGCRVRVPEHWNVTKADALASYPCDRLANMPVRPLTRGINVDAPADVAFRWLCQLRVAPYSYDWIDNLGRRSPRVLTPGADVLARGQELQIFRISDFVIDEHITGRAIPVAERLFGVIVVIYAVVPCSRQSSRLIVRLLVHQPATLWQRLRWPLLAWGDLVMMRKQLRTLKALAEQTAQRTAASCHCHGGHDRLEA